MDLSTTILRCDFQRFFWPPSALLQMIFTTYWFLIFAAVTVAGYWLVFLPKIRQWFLAAACLIFHAHFAGPAGMLPVMILMVLAYAAGLTRQKWACTVGIVVVVATLCFYKYTAFLLGQVIEPWAPSLAANLGATVNRALPSLPPLGISFFAFEFVHYLTEIRRGGAPIRNPITFLLFSIFFPSLVAGPIKRYDPFVESLEAGSRAFRSDDFAEGLRRIAIGFFKKVALADNLTFFIDQYHGQFATLGLIDRWTFVAAIALRILFDFSGYSDIAIGFARLLGIKLPENFNWPYLAHNIQEFWQRWHISLSSWIRDYVYIPLGGNRLGPVRRIVNGLIAFGLCGLWHGPAWHFVFWGLYHGAGLSLCATYRRIPVIGPRIAALFEKEPIASLVVTQLFVAIGWLFFFYPVSEAWQMAQQLFKP